MKLCVGAASLNDLTAWRETWLQMMRDKGLPPEFIHHTRQIPKRRHELLEGGSLYWVINGFIEARQRIMDIRAGTDGEGRARCALVLDYAVIPTQPQPRRPFQGWRYLKPQDAPLDRAMNGAKQEMPAQMQRDLAGLGLL